MVAVISPLFVPAQPDTGLDLPHLTWGSEWREPIQWFCSMVATGKIAPAEKVPYGRSHVSYTVPVDVIDGLPGSGSRSVDLWALSRAFYEFHLPSVSPMEGAALTGMLDSEFRDEMLTFFAWLRATLVFWSGQELAAHVIPTGTSGVHEDGGEFPLHTDVWHTQTIFNFFSRTRRGGATLLIPMTRVWEVLRNVDFPETVLEQMQTELDVSSLCGDFWTFNDWLWSDEPQRQERAPLAQRGRAALREACTPVLLKPGQGYFITDRKWMHGRTELWLKDWEHDKRDHRLYRIGYNSLWNMKTVEATGFDWGIAGTVEAGCPPA